MTAAIVFLLGVGWGMSFTLLGPMFWVELGRRNH